MREFINDFFLHLVHSYDPFSRHWLASDTTSDSEDFLYCEALTAIISEKERLVILIMVQAPASNIAYYELLFQLRTATLAIHVISPSVNDTLIRN